jgi:hypothetical protein
LQFGAPTESAAPLAPTAAAPPAPPPAPQSSVTEETPRFNLGFDPFAKAPLPFELHGHGEAETGENTAEALSPSSPSSFLAGPTPVSSVAANSVAPSVSPESTIPAAPLPDAEVKLANALPNKTAGEFLAGPAATNEPPVEAAPPPKMLHIRCPSGHIVKAKSDLLGKLGRCPACKKTFELRYENSLEFKRRTENILRRDENEASRAWIGWIFVAAFLIFVAIVGAVLMMGR